MKNDFLTLIRTRRSIRAYKPDAVPADVLARVLEAGTYAPSAMGEQSATIVAVATKAYRDRLTKLNAACPALVGLIHQGHEIIVSHGNGPQVGMIQTAFDAAAKTRRWALSAHKTRDRPGRRRPA